MIDSWALPVSLTPNDQCFLGWKSRRPSLFTSVRWKRFWWRSSPRRWVLRADESFFCFPNLLNCPYPAITFIIDRRSDRFPSGQFLFVRISVIKFSGKNSSMFNIYLYQFSNFSVCKILPCSWGTIRQLFGWKCVAWQQPLLHFY